MNISVGNAKKHVGMEVLLISKKSVRLITTIFKISLILRVAGRIEAIAAADQNNGKTVLRRHPYDPLVSIDQTILSLRKFRGQSPLTANVHQLIVRATKTNHDGLTENPLLQFLAAKPLPFYVRDLHVAVDQRMLGIILKIGSFYDHSCSFPVYAMPYSSDIALIFSCSLHEMPLL